VLLRGVGVEVPANVSPVPFVDSLSPEKALALAGFINDNPVPTGVSDVPGDGGEFEHPPAEPDPAFDDEAERTTPMDVGPS
jgi:hypothetical protein